MIAVPDLMYRALELTAIWFEPIGILTATALVYIAVITLLSTLFKWYIDRVRQRLYMKRFRAGTLAAFRAAQSRNGRIPGAGRQRRRTP